MSDELVSLVGGMYSFAGVCECAGVCVSSPIATAYVSSCRLHISRLEILPIRDSGQVVIGSRSFDTSRMHQVVHAVYANFVGFSSVRFYTVCKLRLGGFGRVSAHGNYSSL